MQRTSFSDLDYWGDMFCEERSVSDTGVFELIICFSSLSVILLRQLSQILGFPMPRPGE